MAVPDGACRDACIVMVALLKLVTLLFGLFTQACVRTC